MEVMAKTGYERASVVAIAKAATLTPGLVHYHFRNKQQILLRLVEHLTDFLHARIESLLETTEAPSKRVQAVLDAHLARGPDADPRAVACWVAIAAEAIRQPEVREAFARSLDRTQTLLVEEVKGVLSEEGRSTRNAKRIAAALISAIQGVFLVHAAVPSVSLKGKAAASVGRMARGLIDAERKTAGV